MELLDGITLKPDASLRDGPDDGGIDPVLLRENAGRKGVLRVVVVNGHARLGDDRPGVDAVVDEVDGAPGDLHTVREGVTNAVRTREAGQQRGVGVHEPAAEAAEAAADYLAFVAFYPTATKEPKTRADPDLIAWWAETMVVPCVAIGGITVENAWPLIEKLNGKKVPDLKFFHMDSIKIGGKKVRTLRHGMAGAPGLEIWGPYAEREKIRETIIKAGEGFGLRQVGSRAYATNTLESGWIPSPLPAVYTDERMRKYRKWLPANSYEATGSLAGSFVSDNIEDYYVTPFEIGYGPFVKFDHEFIGREALEKIAQNPRRRKVTLVLDSDDVMKGIGTIFEPHPRTKYFEFPSAVYSTLPYDKVTKNGRTIGISTWCGYSSNEGKMLTLAILDAEHAEPGTQVTFVWGEEGGGSKKPTVERHQQLEIRATVAPVPYVETVRAAYRSK